MYIVIRAGGVGTRLWPLSRQYKPKQLHALTTPKTLLRESIDRVIGIVDSKNIYVSCNTQSESAVRQELAELFQDNMIQDNLIIEPALRDTAAAVGLETITIARQHPQAIIASLGSDHVITDTAEFQRILTLAETTIQRYPDHIICIGVTPASPDTGYGYIELADTMANEIYKVTSFKEKPDRSTAEQFVNSGKYLWNANMFVWRADTIMSLFAEHQPAMYAQLIQMQAQPETISSIYPELQKIAIDYAIIEHTNKILAIPGNFGWNDIGDWGRLHDEMADPASSNYIKADHFGIDTTNTVVFSTAQAKRLIATIGLDNVVIVDTDDALLICDKQRSQDVKTLVDELHKRQRNDVL